MYGLQAIHITKLSEQEMEQREQVTHWKAKEVPL